MSEKSFEDALQQKAKEAKFISLSELPATVEATISKYEFKSDKRGNEALYVQLKLSNGSGMVVQKYGKSLYEPLLKSVKACGGLKPLQETAHTWKQDKQGRAQFNRYFPVSKTETPVEVAQVPETPVEVAQAPEKLKKPKK